MRYRSQCRASLLSVALIGAATAAAFSSEPAHATVDQTTAAPTTQINADALSRAQAKLARAQAIAARHADQAAALGYNDNAWRYELIAHLMKVDAQTLTEIEADADLAPTLKHASRAAAQADSVQPKSIGDVSDDLVFTPITPCRIIDTRNAGAGGAFAAQEIRTYTYAGSTAQGGSNCVISTVTPGALAVNVTIQTTGIGTAANLGHLSIYPQGGNPDAASWLNYTGNEIEANAGVATINQTNGEFSVYTQIPTQVIVDVFGVLRPPHEAGVAGYLPEWTPNGNTLGNSPMYVFGEGFIGLGTTTPTNRFQIGPTAAGFTGNDFAIGDNGQIMAFLQETDSSRWYSSNTFALLPSGGTGYVGIGSSAPKNKLEIGTVGGFAGNDLAFGSSFGTATGHITEVSAIAQTVDLVQWISTTDMSLIPGNGYGGNLGINTTTPVNKLQIGSVGASNFNGNDIAFGNGTDASGIAQTSSLGQWYSTQNIGFFPANGAGNVGINTNAPANQLQIGSIGSANFSGNQFAFGNGTDASAFAQATPSGESPIAWWYSTTNIALMPNGNGHGRVGINTTTPIAPLEVDDYVTIPNGYYTYFNYDTGGSIQNCYSCTSQPAIVTPGTVYASEFDAFSDARIKDIDGISPSARDLDTINSIEVTDYTMKDKVKYGNTPFKKVIAQQVEAVYPQVVAKHADFIPNVYQSTTKVESVDGGYLLSFQNSHGLSKTAKKLKVLSEGVNTMMQLEIAAIPSDREVIVKASGWTGDKAFVYGEQVDDFRTVDYDGLTALNISATQELSKRLAQQQTALRDLAKDKDAQIAALRDELSAEQTRVAALEHTALDLAELKAQVAALKQSRDLPSGISVAMQK